MRAVTIQGKYNVGKSLERMGILSCFSYRILSTYGTVHRNNLKVMIIKRDSLLL
ncbi:hypothetical protein GCM10007971_18550 [Oceanobacillus indicireducens]|uniref:Uncharacterized protein n=1 Tax=Oceanobacillus indicireducens TaxID=1004261 RepID=A0A918D1Q6_9BACI|nr:hypothetical protein GCM10007971_18550 [Oceanobacillus indicireducens]